MSKVRVVDTVQQWGGLISSFMRVAWRGRGGEVVKSGVEAEQLVGESENHMVGSCKEGDHTTRSLDRGTRIKRNNLTSHLNAFTHSFTSSASHSPDCVRRRIIVVAANLDKLHNPRLR